MECPYCKRPINVSVSTCPHCGAEVMKICPECKNYVRAELDHCPSCGASLISLSEAAKTVRPQGEEPVVPPGVPVAVLPPTPAGPTDDGSPEPEQASSPSAIPKIAATNDRPRADCRRTW